MIGMFGFVGLAECVNKALGLTELGERYGHNEKADAFGEAIMDRIRAEIEQTSGRPMENTVFTPRSA